MPLELLNIYNARNIKELTFKPCETFNIIYGTNGSGKTTILESIYFLLRTRIFRNNKYKSFINLEADTCTIYSKFSSLNSNVSLNNFSLGISRSKDKLQPLLHLNNLKVSSLSQISNLVILGLITPESFNLLDAGPSTRRKFLDWGVFHVEHDFVNYWKSYRKILNNRNNVLKELKNKFTNPNDIPSHLLNDLHCWSPQFIELNNKLNKLREQQLNNISEYFNYFIKQFSVSLAENISLCFYQGWTHNINYKDYISDKLNQDINSGFTRYGTHRSDIIIKYKNIIANDVLSRGQKKIIIICLILAQFYYLKNISNINNHNLLLLDDMDSELDHNNLNILLNILNEIDSQVLMTTTNKEKYTHLKENYQLFHVEQLSQ